MNFDPLILATIVLTESLGDANAKRHEENRYNQIKSASQENPKYKEHYEKLKQEGLVQNEEEYFQIMSSYDRGLTQIAPATAVAYTNWRGHPYELYNPETNLRVIIDFLRNRGFDDETDTGLQGALTANTIVNTNSRTGTTVEGHTERANTNYNLLYNIQKTGFNLKCNTPCELTLEKVVAEAKIDIIKTNIKEALTRSDFGIVGEVEFDKRRNRFKFETANDVEDSLLELEEIVGTVIKDVGYRVDIEKSVDQIVADLRGIIIKQRDLFASNSPFLEGIVEIEISINNDYTEYSSVESAYVKGLIRDRLDRWKSALERRAKYFKTLPNGVVDLPDRGLYEYEPLDSNSEEVIELTVTHYTSKSSYDKIKTNFEFGNQNIMLTDGAGWTYFVSEPIPERLTIKRLMNILGTGLQSYVPFAKTSSRTPEYYLTFKIKVPKNRVLIKKQFYKVDDESNIEVIKYAIANGISRDDLDLSFVPLGGRYLNKNLDSEYSIIESFKIDGQFVQVFS